jgi:hypothetical protein
MRAYYALALIGLLQAPAAAQVIEATAGPFMPLSLGNEKASELAKRADADLQALAVYATTYLGAPGAIDQALPNAATSQHHFPSLHFVVSAVTRMTMSHDHGGGRNLRRLNAHIRVEPLDSERRPVDDRAALHILDIQPNTVKAVEARRDSSGAIGAAITVMTRDLLPQVPAVVGRRVGPLVKTFMNVFHHADAPTQISYVSDDRDFGWTWYEHDKDTIEGAHAMAAILEVGPSVRFVRVTIDVLTDWKSHGAWRRQFEQVIDLGSGK